MSAALKFAADPRRRAMIGKVHVAKKELALSQDDYEAVLTRVTGKSSCSDCTDQQLDMLLAELERLGFRPKAAGPRKNGYNARSRPPAADHPSAKKARAMWISLYNLGAVQSAAEAALEAFARRQLGVERLQWADQAKCFRLIEALKAMAERAGWFQGPMVGGEPAPATVLLTRLIVRQCELLQEAGDARHTAAIIDDCLRAPVARWTLLPAPRLQDVAARLGERVRALKDRAA